jgi:hypothetical protein
LSFNGYGKDGDGEKHQFAAVPLPFCVRPERRGYLPIKWR